MFADYSKLNRDQTFLLVFQAPRPSSLTIISATGHEMGQANQIWLHLRGSGSDFIREHPEFAPVSLKQARFYCVKPHSDLQKLLIPSFSDILDKDAVQSGWDTVCSNPSLYKFYSFTDASDTGKQVATGIVAISSADDIYVAAQM